MRNQPASIFPAMSIVSFKEAIGGAAALPRDRQDGNIPLGQTRMEDIRMPPQPSLVQQYPAKPIQEEFKSHSVGPPIPTQLTKDFLNIVKKGNLSEIVNFISISPN